MRWRVWRGWEGGRGSLSGEGCHGRVGETKRVSYAHPRWHIHTHTHTYPRSSAPFSTRAYLQGGVFLRVCVYLLLYLPYLLRYLLLAALLALLAALLALHSAHICKASCSSAVCFFFENLLLYWLCVLLRLLYFVLYLRVSHYCFASCFTCCYACFTWFFACFTCCLTLGTHARAYLQGVCVALSMPERTSEHATASVRSIAK
jgi:hypothetical protein